MASNGLIPATRTQAAKDGDADVGADDQSATMCERGMTFCERSEDSVWNNRMPPMRSNGRIATAIPIKRSRRASEAVSARSECRGDMVSRPLSTWNGGVMPDILLEKRVGVTDVLGQQDGARRDADHTQLVT